MKTLLRAFVSLLSCAALCLGVVPTVHAEDGCFAVPDGVTVLKGEAFSGCVGMTGVMIPQSVTSIGTGAFRGCTQLRDVYYDGNAAQWDAVEIGGDNSALIGAALHFARDPDTAERMISYAGYQVEFGPRALSVTATAGMDNSPMALLCAMMSAAVYSPRCTELETIYSSLFDGAAVKMQFDDENSSYVSGFAFGEMTIRGIKTNVLFIAIRGTDAETNFGVEMWADIDHTTVERWGRESYKHVCAFEDKVLSRLDRFVEKYPEIRDRPLKIVITGHSLGGGTANLLAVRFTRAAEAGAWWSPLTEKEDIFCYTFGAIDTLYNPECETVITNDRTDFPVREGYENIHNIFNTYDPMGPADGFIRPAGNTAIGKYGHMDFFSVNYKTSLYELSANHEVTDYLRAVSSGVITEQREDFTSEISFESA